MLVAQFYSWYMFINKEDKKKLYQGFHPVFCVVYDINTGIFRTADSIEQHFKFNPWEVLSKEQIVGEELFRDNYSRTYSIITNIIKDRIHINYDKFGKIVCNYKRENL